MSDSKGGVGVGAGARGRGGGGGGGSGSSVGGGGTSQRAGPLDGNAIIQSVFVRGTQSTALAGPSSSP